MAVLMTDNKLTLIEGRSSGTTVETFRGWQELAGLVLRRLTIEQAFAAMKDRQKVEADESEADSQESICLHVAKCPVCGGDVVY